MLGLYRPVQDLGQQRSCAYPISDPKFPQNLRNEKQKCQKFHQSSNIDSDAWRANEHLIEVFLLKIRMKSAVSSRFWGALWMTLLHSSNFTYDWSYAMASLAPPGHPHPQLRMEPVTRSFLILYWPLMKRHLYYYCCSANDESDHLQVEHLVLFEFGCW